jgi:lactose/L-arabinose transport system ATP-binding protein
MVGKDPGMTTIELKDVRKAFGQTHVIHGIDLRIEGGELCVFVGPSGCGKSTLLRMIAGLEDVTSGEVAIDGQVVNHIEPSARGLAMVFQSYALYPHMTVAGNMSFGLRMTGMSRPETEKRVAEAARILQLHQLLHRKPAQLSGGQRQRVAIGRAIVRQPKAFLFDEPLSNLDAELRVQMRVEIAKLHQDLGATMIYVTHDQVEAMTLADKIVVLRAGRIEQAGPPADLYGDPQNIFVAGFIGSPKMNLLPAKITGTDGRPRVELPGVSFDPGFSRPLPPGQPVTVGIRPEHFVLGESMPARLSLAVEVIENLGGTSIIHGRLEDGATVLVEHRGQPTAKAGDRLSAGFDPGSVFLFDADGSRLRG